MATKKNPAPRAADRDRDTFSAAANVPPIPRSGFGRSRGVIEGVRGAAGVPLSFLTPACWKRTVGIPPGKEGAKDAARSETIRRLPGHSALFARVKDDGRAEAALIAVAGLVRQEGGRQ
jgi:hypothetical protein